MILNRRLKSGFTIVETMISMAFISMLMLGIAFVSLQVIRIYRKGNAIKDVNQIGRIISSDFQVTLGSSIGFNNQDLVNYPKTNPIFGVLCTGEYSYMWNYGAALVAKNNQPDDRILYFDGYNINNLAGQVRLVKIKDVDKSKCRLAREGKLNHNIDPKTVIDLIKASDSNMALQDIKVLKAAASPDSGESIIVVNFVLGTFFEKDIISADSSCRSPSEIYSANDYCAINKFELTIRSMK